MIHQPQSAAKTYCQTFQTHAHYLSVIKLNVEGHWG